MILTDNQLSAIIGGIVGGIIGVAGAMLQAFLATRRRRAGVVRIIGHEIMTNLEVLDSWMSRTELPVRSVYIWQALLGESGGLLSHDQVAALSDFYYEQAKVYRKDNTPDRKQVNTLIDKGRVALRALGMEREFSLRQGEGPARAAASPGGSPGASSGP